MRNLWLAALVLLACFVIRSLHIRAGFFVDEFDNLAGGRLLLSGHTLYRDYFSHHFPLPYLWLAAVFKLLGPHWFSARFSLLALEILTAALLLRLTRRILPLAISLLAWELVSPFYFGHMVIYYSFSRIGFFFPFASILLSPIAALTRTRTRLLIWVFTAIAVGSDPLMIPTLALVHLRWLVRRRDLRRYGQELLLFFAGAGAVVALLAALKLFSPDGFWKDAVLFNIQVYRKYAGTYDMFVEGVVQNLSTGLKLLDRRWMKWDILAPLDMDVTNTNHHIFTGFFFRLAILILGFTLLADRRFIDALWVYGSSAVLLAARDDFFHSAPFVMMALLAAALLVSRGSGLSRPLPVSVALRGFAAVAMAWLGFRALAGQMDPGFESHFQWRKWLLPEAQKAEELACGRPDVALGDYPGGVHLNFLTGRRPVGGYPLLFPWMAEWGLQTIIDRLRTDPAVVRIRPEEMIWGRFRAGDYLQPLIDFLDGNLTLVDGFYVSPQVIRDCPSIRPYVSYMIDVIRRRSGSSQWPLVILTSEPTLLGYIQTAAGVPIRGADPRHALLIPEGGACFLAAPAPMLRELPSWGFNPQEFHRIPDPWPTVCLPAPAMGRARMVWEGSVFLQYVIVQGAFQRGGELEIIAFWQYRGATSPDSIHVFHHLLTEGRLVAQADGPLSAGFGWQPGDLIGTRYRISLPATLAPGTFELRIGLYRWPSLERLLTRDGSDSMSLGTWKVSP